MWVDAASDVLDRVPVPLICLDLSAASGLVAELCEESKLTAAIAHPEVRRRLGEGVHLLHANRAALTALGARDVAELSRSGHTFMVEDSWRACAIVLSAFEQGARQVQQEVTLATLAGLTRDYLLTVARDSDDVAVVSAVDVTESKSAERWAEAERRAREHSEAKYHGLYEHAPDAFMSTDLKSGRLVECNRAAEALTGRPRAALIGCSIRRLFDAQSAMRLGEALAAGAPLHSAELFLLRPDGTLVPVAVSATVVEDHRGNPVHSSIVVHDLRERRRLERELERQTEYVIEAQEAERARVARELHDGVLQTLASIKMRVATLLRTGDAQEGESVVRLVDLTLGDVRRLAQRLRPALLDELGLPAALEQLAAEASQPDGLQVEMHCAPGLTLHPDAAAQLFRIAQEALANVQRHAGAETAIISLVRRDSVVHLQVRDDGCGFAAANRTTGMGLINMRERARLIGGVFTITSDGRSGTEVRVTLPHEEQETCLQNRTL